MKIKFLATAQAPEYKINGEIINGIDLSLLEEGDKFTGNEETREAGIRDAYRENGDLYVVIKQVAGANRKETHWRESDWIDAGDYDPESCYIKALHQTEKDEIVWGTDMFGKESWIVNKKED